MVWKYEEDKEKLKMRWEKLKAEVKDQWEKTPVDKPFHFPMKKVYERMLELEKDV